MNIDSREAKASLDLIDSTQLAVRNALTRQSGRIVLAWGVAYLLGPLAVAANPAVGPWITQLLLIAAMGWTVYECSRKSLVTGMNQWQFGVSWAVLFLFGGIWFVLLNPVGPGELAEKAQFPGQAWGYGVSLAMFAYAMMGLWISRVFLVIALMTTTFVLIGRFVIPEGPGFWLWSGLTEGGTLLLGGLYLLMSAKKVAS